MFTTLDPLREPLLAARLLREEILAMPVPPSRRTSIAADVRVDTAPGAPPSAALAVAARAGSTDDFLSVPRSSLEELAALCGDGALRTREGETFHGRRAPPAAEVPGLLDELLATINSARAIEVWSPVLRAFALHFTLRLVQPFAAPPGAVAETAEAMILASDGFDARRMRLGRGPSDAAARTRPDPDAFALERIHALVEALGVTRDALRAETARALLLSWAESRVSGLNARQCAGLLWLAEPGRSLTFRDYITFNANRGRPSLRSLQRDWRGLREAGWIEERTPGAFVLSTAPLEWGAAAF